MSSLITSLKSEIARVARKELKDELFALRKATTAHRSEIAALKRQIKSLASSLKASTKASRASNKDTAAEEPATPGIRFSSARLAAFRSKVGISQAQLATLIDVSYLSVHKWEAGSSKPRAAQLAKIAVILKLGKREVQKSLHSE